MTWIFTLAGKLLTADADMAEARRFENAMTAEGAAGAEAYLEFCRMVGEAADPSDLIAALDAVTIEDAGAALGVTVAHCFAAVRVDYKAQPDAEAAREALHSRAQSAYPAIAAVFGFDAMDFVVRLVGQTAVELSRIAASRAPLVRVDTGISMPSARLAYELYGDPARAAELVNRNGGGTPMLMPSTLTAVAR